MSVVLYETKGSVAVVTLNRPEARNAISPEVIVRLTDIWQEVANDENVRAVVITGSGEQAFCAGADLARLVPLLSGARQPEDEFDRRVLEDPRMTDRAVLRVSDLDKPVIAAINGPAIAGGMELVLGTDLRIAADRARFGLQEVRWGLFPMGGSTVRVPVQVPYAVAMEILLTGQLMDARRAYELGFVNRVVPPAAVMEEALRMAEIIAANGPLAVRAIKRSVKACLGLPEREAMTVEIEHGQPIFDTYDAREGPLAFLEKRTPKFEGR
ncbi:MAG: enoyl-CoA hydratase [Acidimicrobiia bacterium]|jgi:enoyl-CoA hydratase|nr:enoyl-CoA hydratase [Acidimicrobiia bacterium]